MVVANPITLFELLSLLLSLTGLLVVVVTALALLRQARQATIQSRLVAESLRYAAYDSLARQFSQIKEALIMNPELRPYFYAGRQFAGGDDVLYQRLASIAEIFLDMFEILILNRRQFPKIFAEDTWHRFMLGIFEASPFLCDYLETVARWYTRELLDTMLASSARRRAVPTTPQAPENLT